MITYNNLFEKITDIENIKLAIPEAAKKKRKKLAVRRALKNLDLVAEATAQKLKNGTWRPKAIHDVRQINDGIALKKRNIVCPEFVREQIVHHAILRVCGPLFMKKFYHYSFGSVPGKGKEKAIKAIRKAIQDHRKAKYYTVLDVHHFFESVEPLVAFRAIRRTISDKRVLLLFFLILHNNLARWPNGTIKRDGLLMGMYTSPWIGNIVLDPVDHILKDDHSMYFVARYMDDIIIIHSNKRKMLKAITAAEDYLKSIGLQLKQQPAIHKVDDVPISYIGATITREKAVMRPAPFLRAKRTAKRLAKKKKLSVYDARKILSMSGQFKHLNTHQAYKRYIAAYVSKRRCRHIVSRKDRENNVVDKKRKQF